MVIDKSKEYWHGDRAEDIIEYLNEYSENEIDKTVIVKCKQCGSDVFTFNIDADGGVIEATCTACKQKRLLLDSEDYWEESEPENAKCLCKKNQHNVAVGFVHRETGDVKWVYIGNRCVSCGMLGSFGDWKISY
jgi:hypothetical protein